QVLQRLIRRKAWPVSGDLEEDAVGLAEIEAAEVVAVDRTAVGDAILREALGPSVVLVEVRRAERDMVDAAGAASRRRQVGLDGHVQLGAKSCLACAAVGHFVDVDGGGG